MQTESKNGKPEKVKNWHRDEEWRLVEQLMS